jgi:ribose transport system ATP-binding protein
MSVLQLRGVSKSFGHTIALGGVDLALEAGRVHALIGENGAGKSTLMNVVAGAVQPDEGLMELNGAPYTPFTTMDSRRSGIALVHQELSLAPHLTVAENILMGIETARFGWVDRKRMNRRAGKVLDNFDHPDIKPDTIVGELSTAAQQVVEICRAIAARARIILMDEPTSSLQRHDVEHLFRLIRTLTSDGISIIYISHFLEEVREIADVFTVLRDGKSVASGNINETTDETLILHMVGRPVDNLFPTRRKRPDAEPTIVVNDLAAPPALKRAGFQLAAGEILGIAGLIGSGRSEMVRAIFGIDPAAEGEIVVNGRPAAAVNAKPAVRLSEGVGYLSEDRKQEGLALNLSVADNLTMTRFSACSRLGWLDLGKQRRQSNDLVQNVGIKMGAVTQPVQTLSGGNQQKIAIARLIYQDADILLLDEPTRGIDIGSRAKIYELIAELADRGKAILMISSYLPELFGMCDRLAVMSRGRLSEARPLDQWTPELVLKTAIDAGVDSATVN